MKYYELESVGFEEFGQCGSGGYDWSEFAVYLKDSEFWWVSDCGCSCNSFGDYLDLPADFEGHGNAHDAIKALHSWVSGQYGTYDSEALLTKLMDYKPAKETK